MEPQKTPSSPAPDDAGKLAANDMPPGAPPLNEADTSPAPSDSDASASDTPAASVPDASSSDSSDQSIPNESASDPIPEVSAPAADEAKPGVVVSSDLSSDAGTDPTVSGGLDTNAPGGDATAPVVSDPEPRPLPVASPHGHKKGLIIGLIIAAVLLVLGGSAAAGYFYLLNKPENVLKMALANSLDSEKTKTMQFSGAFTVTDEASDMDMTATFQGQGSNESGAFDVSGKLDVFVMNVTFDMRSPDGKNLYFKVGGLEGLPEMLAATEDPTVAAYAPLLTALNDQWIEVNESLLKQFSGNTVEGQTFSKADVKKIENAYLKHSFLVIKEVLPDEVIKGTNSYHYRLVVDGARLKAFAKAIKDANLDSVKITDEQLQSMNKAVDEADFNKYPFDVWITKGDKMINQLAMKINEDGAAADLRLTVDSYNKPVKVEKPADSKSLLDVFSSFLLGEGASSEPFLPEFEDSGISL